MDARQNVAREETAFEVHLLTGAEQLVKRTVVFTEHGTYSAGEGDVSEGPPRDCGGARLSTSIVLGCNIFLAEATSRTELGNFEGRNALVFVHEGLSIGSDETTASTARVFLDPITFLPFGAEIHAKSPSQGEVTGRQTYEVQWISRDSLPPDFFDPAAIGFDREAAIRNATDLQVYWLGNRFEAPGVESLVLKSTYAAPGRGVPYRYSLTYARASSPHEPPLLVLQVFFREEWEKSPALPGQAVIFGQTVVFLSEARAQEGPNEILTPETLEVLKAGLRPYQ